MASPTSSPIAGGWPGLEARRPRREWHPEDALDAALVGILWVGARCLLGDELGVLLPEGAGALLEEDQAEDAYTRRRPCCRAARRRLPEIAFVADCGRRGC